MGPFCTNWPGPGEAETMANREMTTRHGTITTTAVLASTAQLARKTPPSLEWDTIDVEFFAREADLYRVEAAPSWDDLD